jgi:hypothetical protein
VVVSGLVRFWGEMWRCTSTPTGPRSSYIPLHSVTVPDEVPSSKAPE